MRTTRGLPSALKAERAPEQVPDLRGQQHSQESAGESPPLEEAPELANQSAGSAWCPSDIGTCQAPRLD